MVGFSKSIRAVGTCVSAALLVGVNSVTPAAAQVNARIAAQTGDVLIPQELEWANFSYINWANQPPSKPPTIADSGHVSFTGTLRGPGLTVANDKAIGRANPSGAIDVIGRRSSQAPETPNGVVFFDFSEPVIGSYGRISVRASLSGPGVDNATNLFGIWSKGHTPVELDVREGDSVPGAAPGTVIATLQDPSPVAGNNLSDLVVRTSLGGPSAIPGRIQAALSVGDSGAYLRLRDGDVAPGTDGAVFSGPQFVLHPSGAMVVYSALTGNGVVPANGVGLWHYSPDHERLVVRSGSQAPGTQAGVTFTQLSSLNSLPAVDTEGRVAFNGGLTGPGVDALNNSGVWLHDGGQAQLLVRAGNQVPGATGGVTFAQPVNFGGDARSLALSEDGTVTFLTLIRGTGVTNSNNRALIAIQNGITQLVARGGAPANQMPSGVTFYNASIGEVVRVGPYGHVAIRAKVQGTSISAANDYGIWRVTSDGLVFVAREGDVVDNYRIHTITEIPQFQVGASGQVLFRADLIETSDPYAIRRPAILATDVSGTLHVVAVEGGRVSLPTGPSPLLSAIKMSERQAINASGEIAFVARMEHPQEPVFEAIIVASLDSVNECPADFNHDGSATTQDLFDFLTAFFAQIPSADFNGNGSVATQDIFDFLSAWFEGC